MHYCPDCFDQLVDLEDDCHSRERSWTMECDRLGGAEVCAQPCSRHEGEWLQLQMDLPCNGWELASDGPNDGQQVEPVVLVRSTAR